MAYADDVDFISKGGHVDLDKIEPIMNKYNLIINKDKTRETLIETKKNGEYQKR